GLRLAGSFGVHAVAVRGAGAEKFRRRVPTQRAALGALAEAVRSAWVALLDPGADAAVAARGPAAAAEAAVGLRLVAVVAGFVGVERAVAAGGRGSRHLDHAVLATAVAVVPVAVVALLDEFLNEAVAASCELAILGAVVRVAVVAVVAKLFI